MRGAIDKHLITLTPQRPKGARQRGNVADKPFPEIFPWRSMQRRQNVSEQIQKHFCFGKNCFLGPQTEKHLLLQQCFRSQGSCCREKVVEGFETISKINNYCKPLQITVHNDEVAKDRTLTWRIGQRSLVMWIFAGRIIQRSVHAIHLVFLFGGRRFRFCSAFGGLLSVHCTNLKRKEGL